MYIVVTGGAYDQGLSLVLRHTYDPGWLVLLPFPFEVAHLSDVVDLNVLGCATYLTGLREHSLFERGASVVQVGHLVHHEVVGSSSEGVTAEACNEWLSAISFYLDHYGLLRAI
jgi:hypothetical protein